MAFTYDITTDRGKVRFGLGDSTQDKGPRPRKNNFSDAEIDYFLTTQSGGINKSVAMGPDMLGNEWLSYSLAEKDHDLSYDAKGLADVFFRRAKELSSTPDGGAIGEIGAGGITLDFIQKSTP